jgi:hypothetical protein
LQVHNASKSLKAAPLRQFYRLVAMKRAAGIETGFGLWTRLQVTNQTARPRPPLDTEMLKLLRAFFRNDVERLGLLLHRDLSSWLV